LWVELPLIFVVGIAGIPAVAFVSAPFGLFAAWLLETLTGREWGEEVAMAIAVIYVAYLIRCVVLDHQQSRKFIARMQERLDELAASRPVAQHQTVRVETAKTVYVGPANLIASKPDVVETWPEMMRRQVPPLSRGERYMPPYLGTGRDFIDVRTAARWMGVSWTEVLRLIKDGTLHRYRIGSRIHVSATEVHRFKTDKGDDGTT